MTGFVVRDDYVQCVYVSRTYTVRTDACLEHVGTTVPLLAAIDYIYMACLPRAKVLNLDRRSYLIYLCHRFSARTAQIAATGVFRLLSDTGCGANILNQASCDAHGQ